MKHLIIILAATVFCCSCSSRRKVVSATSDSVAAHTSAIDSSYWRGVSVGMETLANDSTSIDESIYLPVTDSTGRVLTLPDGSPMTYLSSHRTISRRSSIASAVDVGDTIQAEVTSQSSDTTFVRQTVKEETKTKAGDWILFIVLILMLAAMLTYFIRKRC